MTKYVLPSMAVTVSANGCSELSQSVNALQNAEHASSQSADIHVEDNSIVATNQQAASPFPDMAAVSFGKLLWRHRFLTISYCLVFWSFGMGIAFLGPTLLDLGCRTGNVFSTMSWVFFSQTFFILVGSASGGWLASRFNKHRVLLVSVFIMGLTLSVIPFCVNLGPLVVTLAVMGFFMGTIDTLANLSMIQLYGRNVGPFLQVLHFFYGLGAFLAPLIVEPFLLNVDCSSFIEPESRTLVSAANASLQEPIVSLEMAQTKSRVQYAFWIMANMQVPVFILLLIVVIREYITRNKSDNQKPETFEIVDDHTLQPIKLPEETVEKPIVTMEQIILLTGFASLLLFLVDGLQAIYGGYVYSFTIKAEKIIASSDAAYLNALFWGTFALGRLLSVAIATYITPQFMLLGNISGCLFGIVLLLALHHYPGILYGGTTLIGLFLSSVYPTCISLVESYIDITPHITTAIVVSAAAGEMFMPVIVGHEFTSFGPTSFPVTCLALIILAIIVYFILLLIGNNIIRFAGEPGAFGWLRGLICCSRRSMDVQHFHGNDSGALQKHANFYSRMKSESSDLEGTCGSFSRKE